MEIWKDIEGYEGLYQVSNQGNVRSLNWGNTGTIRNLYLKRHPRGYRQVELCRNGTKKMMTVHRLVATAFLANPKRYFMINHIDEDKANNRAENLEWCDNQQNFWHSWDLHHEARPTKRARTRTNSSYPGKVEQQDMNGNVLRVWDNIAAVVKELSFNNWSIIQCCKGKRATAYGFKWRFAI